MKFIKKHLSAIVAIIVFILVVAGIFVVKAIFYPNENSTIYGSRLEGIEKVKVSDETKNKVEKELGEEVESSSLRVQGRIIYITIAVKEGTSVETAKNLGNKTLEYFSDEQKAYFDIQVFLKNEKNETQFPIIGYKHHTKSEFTWTKDRAEN